MGIWVAVSTVTKPKTVPTLGENMHFKGHARLAQSVCHDEGVLHGYAAAGKDVP